ncbi:hypothetical protein M595_0615 [Lyngbya aestuarii BL J]|uniref:Uncharacterized protein n=1 Tax=Lyngbya aestuarii BL J TaxID=1348334 RepID=U7QNL2_9CYAN|nr:hypothetical protein M595_0615 [Lyngbya aestuarii BL J]
MNKLIISETFQFLSGGLGVHCSGELSKVESCSNLVPYFI